ncbi:YkgJ family cysteine cluster protein [Fundidesulfovibrio soli]|uniref:YkgJ family cysteine cluster protein n=1 Tax=Fundidesulfovibrio soli TaxID=2922716 RepID=UPI001FAF7B7F|nr:zinc/iron-chelating domain-containing protein [Fundidesulfovibrio soli]
MTSSPDTYVCAQCASLGPTCCRLEPGQEDLCFPVSELERQRIVDAAPQMGGLTGAPNTAPFLAHMMRLFPRDRAHMASLFPSHGGHLRLATRPDGGCSFLAAEGCILPREVRPYYCRLFPFWVSAGAVAAFDASGCLACKRSKGVRELLAQLGMSHAMVLDLHGRMRLAWGMTPFEDGELLARLKDRVGKNA